MRATPRVAAPLEVVVARAQAARGGARAGLRPGARAQRVVRRPPRRRRRLRRLLKLSRQGAVTSSVGPVAGSSDDVVRVHARCEGVSHRALAHPESREHDHLRDELARHVAAGGATVLVTPIVDPLIVDLSADAERDARATFDGDGDGYAAWILRRALPHRRL